MAKKTDIAAASAARKKASDRWAKAVPAERAAYESAQCGEQMARLAHAEALDELKAAHKDTLDADAAVEAASAEPDNDA